VLRRRSLALTPIAVLALSACGSTGDSDTVARVEHSVLDRDQFTELVEARKLASGVDPALETEAEAARVSGEIARGITGQFVTIELVRHDLAALDVDLPEVDSSLTGPELFDAEYEAIGRAWVSLPPDQIGDERLREWYDAGGDSVCVQHILVAERDEADAVLQRLDAGEAFDAVAADSSLDTASAAQGGNLGCQPERDFRTQFVPEFVEGSVDAEIGVPTGPVETEFGYHVVRVVPFDELLPNDLLVSRLIALGDWYEVETDPEIGVWRFPNVAPLG
jgi:parvulin-like peptidyl-prolyl isomerase